MRTPGFGDRRFNSTSGVLPIAWTMSPYFPPHGRLSRRGSIIASESVVRRVRLPAACHRRQDHEGVALTDRCIQALQDPNVLVVQIDVHVAVELPVLAEELALGIGVLLRQRAEHLAHVRARGGHLLLASGGRAQYGWNLDRAHGRAG